MEPPASKRQRTASTSSQPASPVVVQSSVWYPDGNIILQTGKGTSDAPFTRFRVYKGILADKSSVFKDMFLVAGGDEGEELVDGCPLVQLDDDKEELEHVLRALHMDPSYYIWDKHIPFHAVAGFVRLGRKYDIPQLLSNGLDCIYYDMPSRLQALAENDDWSKIEHVHTHLVDILKLVVACDIRAALPRAYYLCASVTLDELLAAQLSPDMLLICLKGKEKILVQQWQYYMSWVDPAYRSTGCEDAATCADAKLRIVADVQQSDLNDLVDIVEWDGIGSRNFQWNDLLCGPCSMAGKQHHDAQMEQLWKDLPSFFDLPPWDVLLQDKDT